MNHNASRARRFVFDDPLSSEEDACKTISNKVSQQLNTAYLATVITGGKYVEPSALDDDRVRLEHLADGRLAFDNSQIVEAVVVETVDNLRVNLSHMLAECVACASYAVLSKVVVRKACGVSQQRLVQLADVACLDGHISDAFVCDGAGLLCLQSCRLLATMNVVLEVPGK